MARVKANFMRKAAPKPPTRKTRAAVKEPKKSPRGKKSAKDDSGDQQSSEGTSSQDRSPSPVALRKTKVIVKKSTRGRKPQVYEFETLRRLDKELDLDIETSQEEDEENSESGSGESGSGSGDDFDDRSTIWEYKPSHSAHSSLSSGNTSSGSWTPSLDRSGETKKLKKEADPTREVPTRIAKRRSPFRPKVNTGKIPSGEPKKRRRKRVYDF